MLSINRYRLRNRIRKGQRAAKRVGKLLERPDRLIGLILIGNNFVNILASAIATIIAVRLLGDLGIAVATFTLTMVILIFAEVTPKTWAALHPERIAFPASLLLTPLLKLLYPLVWMVNGIANSLLKLLGVNPTQSAQEDLLSREEFRTIINEAGSLLPDSHQDMLLRVLDLEGVTVNDIMVPRNDISAIDLDAPWEEVMRQLKSSRHTRLPLYRDSYDNIVGLIHVRNALNILAKEEFSESLLLSVARDPYFIPESTSLTLQLLNFQKQRRRMALVVDEYGELLGLVTMDDILEEIVGEYGGYYDNHNKWTQENPDGSYFVDGSANVRELNRLMDWDLPTDGPKTISGLAIEHLETIPEPGTSILLARYPIEIMQTKNNKIKTVRIAPRLNPPPAQSS